MSFPLNYTGELVFYKPEGFVTDAFIHQLKLKFNIENNITPFVFHTRSSFSKLPIKVVFDVIDDNTSILCRYNISLFENNLVFIASLVFASFFYFNNSIDVSVIVIALGIVYYLANTSRISHFIKSNIYNILGSNIDYGMIDLWKKQKQWMQDPLLCPACGEPKNKYSNKCVNCGLFFTKDKQRVSQTNTSLSNSESINYEIKNKK